MVSTDQFVSAFPGQLPNTYGRDKESQQYVGGASFIDAASVYFYIHCHFSFVDTNTIIYKHSF